MGPLTELDRLSLVPPARLGRALAQTRAARGLSLAAVAAASRELDGEQLEAIEAGEQLLSDAEIAAVTAAYGWGTDVPSPLPQRSRLVVDLPAGLISADDVSERIGRRSSIADGVLTRYLALIYRLRDTAPGSPVRLRQLDLATLSDVLWLEPGEIEQRLTTLMGNRGDQVGRRTRLFGRRLTLPTVGILVAVTAAGTLVLERAAEELTPSSALAPNVT